MPYKIEKLASFSKSVFEADSDLYAFSAKAADIYYDDYNSKVDLIKDNPYIYRAFEDDPYFRTVTLVYGYRLFYHVNEKAKTVMLHRVIHGAMDLASQLTQEEE